MIKLLISGLFLTFVVICESTDDKSASATIVKYDFHQEPNGEYELYYETSDGTKRGETGTLTTINDAEVIVVSGYYSYIGDDGQEYTVHYDGDDKGFIPSGTHIPEGGYEAKPPPANAPLPPNIAASLAG